MTEFMSAIKKAFDFKGRSRRKEFFTFMSIAVALTTVALIIDNVMALQIIGGLGLLATLLSLFLLVPALAVTVRRLHDTGRSGRWVLLFLIPLAGWIALAFFVIIDGDLGRNMYGKDPNRWNTVFSPINN
jgi:uncharacterized membrane protein YhaH (DUF805 family)